MQSSGVQLTHMGLAEAHIQRNLLPGPAGQIPELQHGSVFQLRHPANQMGYILPQIHQIIDIAIDLGLQRGDFLNDHGDTICPGFIRCFPPAFLSWVTVSDGQNQNFSIERFFGFFQPYREFYEMTSIDLHNFCFHSRFRAFPTSTFPKNFSKNLQKVVVSRRDLCYIIF